MFEDYQKFALQASLGTRFLNSLIDGILSQILLFAVFIPIGYVSETQKVPIAEGLIFVIAIGFRLFYYVFFETIFQKTPAKFITGTKVVMQDGSKPDLGAIIARTVIRFIPFEAFSFLGSEPSGWHDRWSKTQVVSNNVMDDYTQQSPPPPPQFNNQPG
ncbi:MAG: RDD family protein [Pyrinomonadaceae bacterium]|nr:RDD family protein [Pyrinomonadaceae bacterium]